jgi:1-phosphofructokinase family hexose kinase
MIVTITPNPLLDYVLHSNELPAPGGKRLAEIPYTVGGKGINVARMLKTLGRPALALSFAGGSNGEKIRYGLQQQGISCELIETQQETRVGINLVVEKPLYHTWWIENGEELQNKEVDMLVNKAKEMLVKTSYLAMSGTIPGRNNADLYAKILQQCHCFKGEIYIDARGLPLELACRAGGFFLKHNRDEALQTFNLDPFNAGERHDLLSRLRQQKVWGALFTNGKAETLLWDGEQIYLFAPAVAREVSAVGCGDATLAGFIFARSQGMSLLEASRWGMAAGAADCEMAGPCEANFELVESKLDQVKILQQFSL